MNNNSMEGKISSLSIWAFILTLLGCTSIIGLVLAIVDLSKNDGRKKGLSIAALIIQAFLFFTGCLFGFLSPKQLKNTSTTPPVANTPIVATSEQPIIDTVNSEEKTEKENVTNYDFIIASDFENMSVGDIGMSNGIYVGLSYVKEMDSLPVSLGSNQEVSKSDNEVILAFFDYFNPLDQRVFLQPDNITCYADGVQVSDIKTASFVEVDGIMQYHETNLDPKTKVLSVADYEVPKSWEELKFFYNSDCIWTVHKADVHTENYAFHSMFPGTDLDLDDTREGDVIWSSGCQIIYDGFELYDLQTAKETKQMAIFKLTITNTSDKKISSNKFVDSEAYQDGYIMSYFQEYGMDAIDDHINAGDVEDLEKGMSAKMYLAFPVNDRPINSFYLGLDAIVSDEPEGFVYVSENTIKELYE
ncbi:MAG: hypothetical protein K5879_10845 [Lachnospiraceae bacterium]|nr:hypothetical protein [Lachnospiraceae bacterium]